MPLIVKVSNQAGQLSQDVVLCSAKDGNKLVPLTSIERFLNTKYIASLLTHNQRSFPGAPGAALRFISGTCFSREYKMTSVFGGLFRFSSKLLMSHY